MDARFMKTDGCFGYDDYGEMNNESNQSFYYSSNQNVNESRVYMQDSLAVLPAESDFSQANARGMFYTEHDQLSRAVGVPNVDVTNSSPSVSGNYSGVTSGYTLYQPLGAGVQYLQDHLMPSSYNGVHSQQNQYHEVHGSAEASHSLGNNQTILAAARELCYSPFDDQPIDPHQQSSEQVRNFTQHEKVSGNMVVHQNNNDREPLMTTTSTPHNPSPVKYGSLIKNTKSVSDLDPLEYDEIDKLSTYKILIPSLSLEALTGKEVYNRVNEKTAEVSSRYLPCVDFLVDCQQDLRAGLTQKGNRRLLASQFFNTLLAPLPERFFNQNQCIMSSGQLEIAYKEIQALVTDAKEVEHSGGCDGMKSAFLGGMRDGESWGLRKWLSKNGGGLKICNDLELILEALRKLPKGVLTTKLLAGKISPKAKQAYDKLKTDVPNAYQAVSNAHPYLPFFHRLESVLKGLHEFDPDKDDVICIDDDSSVEEDLTFDCNKGSINLKKESINLKKESINFKKESINFEKEVDSNVSTSDGQRPGSGRSCVDSPAFFKSLLEYEGNSLDDDEREIQVLFSKGSPAKNNDGKFSADLKGSNLAFGSPVHKKSSPIKTEMEGKIEGIVPSKFKYSTCGQNLFCSVSGIGGANVAVELTGSVEKVVDALEAGQDIRPLSAQDCPDFWSNPTKNFICILRLFQKLISNAASRSFLEPVDVEEYHSLVKNPLSFRDIVTALCADDETCVAFIVDGVRVNRKKGVLGCASLKRWNMFEGRQLIEAVDLVFLNYLAFVGKSAALVRKDVLKLRSSFWREIRRCALGDRKNIPMKRKESSGFVIRRK